MPEAKKSIHSFSSEDPKFRAANLLNHEKSSGKWKAEKADSSLEFIVFKFNEPLEISNINVGNEGAGIIEIHVANSKIDPPKYHELLFATSLMTLTEAVNEKNMNQVRMFEQNSFIQSVASQKWDLVKIILTQPFNRKIQYGLSFVNIFAKEKPKETENSPSPVKPIGKSNHKTIGKFAFRDSDSDGEEKSPFSRWQTKKDESKNEISKEDLKDQLKSKLASEKKRKRSEEDKIESKPDKQDRNRSKGLFYNSDDDKPNEKLQKKLDIDMAKAKKERKSLDIAKNDKPASPNVSSKFSKFLFDDEPSTSKTLTGEKESKVLLQKSPEQPKQNVTYKPFGKLLEGVTFVLSGYQNPERGTLRQKGIDMGARYKADWDDTCTHLICAYSNTPKANQVKGKGKIVTKNWIERCFSDQKKLPWRRFALCSNDQNMPESDEEIHCEWNKPKSQVQNETEENCEYSDDDMIIIDKRKDAKIESPVKVPSSDSEEDMLIIDKRVHNKDVAPAVDCSDKGVENDEEKNVAREPLADVLSDNESVSSVDITKVECSIFEHKKFYLHNDLSATDIIKLKDRIKHMLGTLTKNASKADYVIAKNGKNLPYCTGECLKDVWVHECYDLQAFIPTKRYKL